jgi:hypothetical protein
LLGDSYGAQEVCQAIKKNHKKLVEQPTVADVYNLAEIYRVYQCDSLKGVPDQVASVLKKDVAKPKNLYYAYLLNEGGKSYGQVGKIENFLKERSKVAIYDAFNQTDFSFDGTGLSCCSLKSLEILANLQNAEPTYKPLIATFLKKFGKQGIQNGDKFSYFSKASDIKSATLNYYLVSILKATNGSWDALTKEQKVGLRNYFVQQAALSSTVTTLLPALKGLDLTGKDVPAIRISGQKTVSVSDKAKNVKFELVDSFGKAFKGAKNVKVSLADLSDNKASVKDVSTQVKVDNSAATWSIPADTSIGRYQLIFNVDGYIVQAPVVIVTDKINFGQVSYAVLQNGKFPTKFDNQNVKYPSKIQSIRQAQDDFFIHISAEASFAYSLNEIPSQVFFSIKKRATPGALPINAYGRYNKETGRFEASLDVTKDLESHFNGDYDITVTAADYRADSPAKWDLGQIKVWFKEGLDEGSNNGVRADYRPLPTIEFSYPPEQPQISLLRPLVGCGLLVALFLRFVAGGLLGNRGNLSNLSFTGVLFLGNLALILVIFTAFFIEVKLIPTLWLLLFLSPITFFVAQRGLADADCSIGEFRQPANQP